MKKILNIFAVLSLLTATSCELFVLDNYDEPNAEVTGRLIDSKTGENVGVECFFNQSGSFWTGYVYNYAGTMVVVEQDWEAVQDQRWNVKFNGEYTNKRVFAGKYVMSTKELPCYLEEIPFTLKPGMNDNVNFTVTPFARVVDPQFSYDAASKKIRATFKVELGDASKANTIAAVRLCAYTDCHVCRNFNLCANDPGASAFNVAEGDTITLEIDTTLAANDEEFKYTREHFLRIAVLANGNDYNSSGIYNFSETYMMSRDFQRVEKYNWAE